MQARLEPTYECPQAVRADLDMATYRMLSDLLPGVHFHKGMRATMGLLQFVHKPMFIVISTDANTPAIEDLRRMATVQGVPTVHALHSRLLGEACKLRRPETAVAIMHAPTHVACHVMSMAAAACEVYASRLLTPMQWRFVSELPTPEEEPATEWITSLSVNMARAKLL